MRWNRGIFWLGSKSGSNNKYKKKSFRVFRIDRLIFSTDLLSSLSFFTDTKLRVCRYGGACMARLRDVFYMFFIELLFLITQMFIYGKHESYKCFTNVLM